MVTLKPGPGEIAPVTGHFTTLHCTLGPCDQNTGPQVVHYISFQTKQTLLNSDNLDHI